MIYIQYFCYFRMKFKKEYRWLLFLIIPFIVFMFVLFMAPLQIVLNAQPLATQTYGLQKSENSLRQLRSTSYQSSMDINLYFEIINQLISLYAGGPSKQFMEINVESVLINNANTYYHTAKLGSIAGQSMWFVHGKNNVSQLSAIQSTIFRNVLVKQVNLRAFLTQQGDIYGSVVGVYNFYDVDGSNNQDMAFYYPSYKQSNYSSLDYQIDRTVYQTLQANKNATNNSYVMIENITRSGLSSSVITLCKLRSGSFHGFTCLDINKAKFNNIVMNTISTESTLINYYLISPQILELTNSTIFINFTSTNSSIDLYQEQSILEDVMVYSPLASTVQPYHFPSLLIFLTSTKSYFLYSIMVWDDYSQNGNVIAYFLVESYQVTSTIGLQSANFLNSSLNTLLIPTCILIIVSLIISIFVLRSLINSLDLELHKLNQCCKFIFDGDLDIEIPEYYGTKDIYQVYEEIKIINKLHRYSSKEYFVGHFSNRIFKYNEALQVVKKLNYDPSNLMENIGEAYIYIEEYDKAIYYLKESIKHIEKQIEEHFGGLDRMVLYKQQKQKVPNTYKDMEIILIRRLWKIIFCLIKYVQLQIINANQFDLQSLSESQKAAKKERLQKQTIECITKLKKALYPDFKCYAESCMLLNFQIKYFISIKKFESAKESLVPCFKVTQAYAKQYDEITKKLKEKGSKNLYFFRRNKLSGHSRASPHIMEAFFNYTRSIVLTNDPKEKDYVTAFNLLCDAFRKNVESHSVNYLVLNEVKKILTTLNISLDKLECTQIFRQSMPYKTLHYGPITKQILPTLYRVARNPAEVECRQYIITLDASYYYSTQKQLTDQLKYIRERAQYLYDKLIKKFDRVSLIQSNSEINIQTTCNLILKQFYQSTLKKSLLDMTNFQQFSGRNQLLFTLETIIFRIKNLQCQKVIIFFLKYIDSYVDELIYKGKMKHKSKSKKKINQPLLKTEEHHHPNHIEQIGEDIEDLMNTQGLRNCKLLLMCATGDQYYRLINVFGLRDINKRIWSHTDGLNKNNNTVYIIDQKHKSDLDRILMSKLPNVSDNHVFAL